MDYWPNIVTSEVVNDWDDQLTARLCTEAAMLMEDVFPSLLAIAGKAEANQRTDLPEIAKACKSIAAIVEAACPLDGNANAPPPQD